MSQYFSSERKHDSIGSISTVSNPESVMRKPRIGVSMAVNLFSKQQEIVRAIQVQDLNRLTEAGCLDEN
jgi:hypothetical protein